MKSLRLLAPAALAVLALGGCASPPGAHCVRLAANGWFCLLPPIALAPRSGAALVTVRQDEEKTVYVGQLAIAPTALRLALANPAGVPLATLSWNGSVAAIEPSGTKLRPELLAALLEFAYAGPDALRTGLHGLTLATGVTPAGAERILRVGDRTVATMHENAGELSVEVPRARLTVTIRPLAGNR